MAAAVKRLLSQFETSATVTTTAAANRHLFRFPINRIFSPIIRFRRYSSSSASVADDETTGDSQRHPWPEWVTFVDRLKSKGYIDPEAGTDVSVYKDMSVLKIACLNFGRDRFDLLKSLCMQDIQTLVEKGCPNIKRKAVNSGKRLRAHLQLVEGDVCGICVFRGSCNRANVMLKDIESDARTVDVVRVLLNYALDPAVDSDNKPSGAEVVEASAKNLLLELTRLSDTNVDPELQIPAAMVARKAQSFEFEGRDSSEMKRGDWMCPKCNFMNFFRKIQCLKCKTLGPEIVGTFDIEMKKGDWKCPQCQFKNFASNKNCLRCREQRPKRQLKIGEWECPSCDFLNFAGNIVCRKCNGEGPKDVEAKYQEYLRRKSGADSYI